MVAGAEAHAVDITKEKAPNETVTKIDARDVGTPDEWVQAYLEPDRALPANFLERAAQA